MQTETRKSDVKRNYYNKNLTFIQHPGIPLRDDKTGMGTPFVVFGLLQFFMRMATNTPAIGLFLGFSTGFTLAWIYFRLWLIPRIRTGHAEAYFRRSYEKVKLTLPKTDLIASITAGTVIANVAYFIHRFQVEGNLDPIFKLILHFNPIGIAAGAMFMWLFFYTNFMQEKYVSVREYSNLYNYFKKIDTGNGLDCHNQVLRVKDKDHDIHEFKGSYLNEDEIKEVIDASARESSTIKRKKRY